ncbi:alanine--tRNA ligase [Candidatus Uhrbacteria bacterium RIFCSPHIGHO2_12_FULL_46_13]|uniref:Alanine--tRNA ligase n=1 Tax=Candidatus Uhrbacteria bacterium RIFCSPLOWO2_01_FULL_47_25 TaxID=1802402 RepID=A0A1F7UY25_9BACT|nr:MAG: alanine--tRNA ligase [Candidatus Uhrbacteria bacterium RIFCSPHIGHO2_01_FULL_46_23]OGL70648.1 MAG: alanine--tRNA ligase [Candidatus Uhrbacteria bacterium RIFCSPHIGHO2_02_FULL_47_29]OGL76414.1 MAG: alanine--tRNA ligase [Candidatus Uhrbacteria bacterium RIFCSPHIGHO2_12_FULL_46_13]OGL83155.1 MAG: alanine--tRNA ligase [Candidatus Uhrbacteria bacterium RIFCSPLOWO2_01_FULL_47_25]OGL84063.1 MAG: alanine--tRNA ligase [Candidatus Uhrbacteria bacterium RIFCSPLOWO2_02_FULL_46_19]
MQSSEIRSKFLQFFQSKGHSIIASASLVPENDPTVLFTTAGMHPLVPYLLGQKHPAGTRLVNVQKCVRVQDIEEVGDNRHDTFFEMLGNWSLGDYFKKEAIAWSFEFFSGPKWLGFDPLRIYVSVFEGDADAPRDDESIKIWQEQFKKVNLDAKVAKNIGDQTLGVRIHAYDKSKNWWGPAGQTGPCGPDTEMFYDMKPNGTAPGGHMHEGDVDIYGAVCHPNCDCGRFIEFWNDVFMEYNKTADGTYESLQQKNVDTGMGLERTAMILQGVSDIFATDLFQPIISAIKTEAVNYDVRAARIVADHIRTAVFILGDGVRPSNVERGYVLRRLIRRAVRYGQKIGLPHDFDSRLANVVVEKYRQEYSELLQNQSSITKAIHDEEAKFIKTLERGLKEFERLAASDHVTERLSGYDAFILFSTYGFPLEMTVEMAKEKRIEVDEKGFWEEFQKHQDISRVGTEKKFKGGLADHSRETTRLHTATHLLHAALRKVLGDHVFQKGSNITAERLRFDFSHPEKLTPEEIKAVEDMVNDVISRDLPVSWQEMSFAEAKAKGALGLFESKYGERVKVYSVGDFSKEVCGGPHVNHTVEVGKFKITKEEAVSMGIRRIKAVVL